MEGWDSTLPPIFLWVGMGTQKMQFVSLHGSWCVQFMAHELSQAFGYQMICDAVEWLTGMLEAPKVQGISGRNATHHGDKSS